MSGVDPMPPVLILGQVCEVVEGAELVMWQNLWGQGKSSADVSDPVVLARFRRLLRPGTANAPDPE